MTPKAAVCRNRGKGVSISVVDAKDNSSLTTLTQRKKMSITAIFECPLKVGGKWDMLHF